MSIRKCFSTPAYGSLGDAHGLRPILNEGAGLAEWEQVLRPALLADWQCRIGHPAFEPQLPAVAPELCDTWRGDGFVAEVYKQPTGFGQEQTVIILHPTAPSGCAKNASQGNCKASNSGDGQAASGKGAPASPYGNTISVSDDSSHASARVQLPAAVVPFYFAERSAGFVVGSAARGNALRVDDKIAEVVPLGLHLVRLGLTVACVEAFPFNTVGRPEGMDASSDPFLWWRAGAQEVLRAHPDWTGLGRLIHDTRRAVDLLLSFPRVDKKRLLLMGHSLGGKMAFFTGAMEPRVTAIIASDFGLPWRSTNWDEPWYLGPRVPKSDDGAALHEVLALLAPRPFFLIAGDTDKRSSWQYLEAARPVYSLYGAAEYLGCIDHSSGHAPAVAALEAAYGWLAEVFTLPHRRWRA